ncbi:transcription termination factor 1-like [Portunus trituberculatus]|uniref:transcription termination factor 1-like n=1 Tax=Portunus trituberculatus TaxID=210409 RepID=UPI001E1D1364|nr:transcription termination factor 1-like [Portunus trituberculatus]
MKKKKKKKTDEEEEKENKEEEEQSPANIEMKKKKKKRKTDEEKEESKDEEKEATPTMRRRKESSCDSDWCARYEENAEVIRTRALSKGERTQEEEEIMARKKKRRRMENKGTEDSECSEAYFIAKKKKKKKRREAEEEEETSQVSSESSFISSSGNVKRKRDKRRGEGQENRSSSEDHTFIMPENIVRRKSENSNKEKDQRRKEKREADKEMTRENTDSHTCQVINVGRPEIYENLLSGKTNKKKHIEIIQERLTKDERGGVLAHSRDLELEREKLKRKLCGGVSRLAYSGLLGWQTDTSVDDQDYSDDIYHRPRDVMQTMRRWERSAASAENEGFIIYSEGEDISGFISCLSSSGEQRKKVPARHVPSEHRSSPGFALEQRNIPTLEEATYEFPRGEGIPEEEMEEVHEYEDFWKIKDKVMQMPLYAEEAKKYIDEKLKYVEDYFEKLKFGHLTPADLKEGKPDNFDDPFFPTPQQLEFLNNLNIVVDWPLSELHTYHIDSYTIPYKPKAEWKALNIFVDHTRISLRDEKILARNWFAFQKEYGFYDLRPLVSVRTARVLRESGNVMVQPFEYLSQRNKVHFLLYLAKDLPYRTLINIYRKAKKLLPFLRGRYLMRKIHQMNGLVLAKMKYVMEIFGADMLAVELLVGPALSSFYAASFMSNFLLRNVKLRLGPWQAAEDKRMLQGLQEIMKVKNFQEAYKLVKIPWVKLFPYIRTRSIPYMRRRLCILAGRKKEKYNVHVRRKEIIKLFYLLYQKDVQSFRELDWEDLGRQVGSRNPIRLEWCFKGLFMEYIPYKQRITIPEGLQYFHDVILPRYKYFIRSRGDVDSDDNQDPDHPDTDPECLDPESREGSVHGLGDLDDGGERGSGDTDLRSRDEVMREQNSHGESSDLRNRDKVMIEKNNLSKTKRTCFDELKSRNKVTEQQNDLQDTNDKKNHTDDLSSSRATQDDLAQAGKAPLQELDEITYIPHKRDLEILNIDLLDSDLDSDGCEFEKVTFGQALGKM